MSMCLIVALTIGAPGLKDRTPPKPEGRFTIERHEYDGRVLPGYPKPGRVIRYTPTACTLEVDGKEVDVEPVSYPEADGPRQVDFAHPEGVKRGIWKVDGDTLTVCESDPRGDRPKDFTAPAGSRRSLYVLKRIKE